MIIFGTKGRVRPSKERDELQNACPQCQNHLKLSDLKRWFTLYFIPIFPFQHVDTFYYCKNCKGSYKKEARSQLLGGKKNQEQLQKEVSRAFGETLIVCLSFMAKADGNISMEEEQLIKKHMDKFKENRDELERIYNEVATGRMNKEAIYAQLRKVSQMLTTEGILMLIAELAKMVLADGRIDEKEEKLMKSFMLICGVSEDLYQTVLDKAKR